MIQVRQKPPEQQYHPPEKKSRLLQRHPVLTPILLVSSAVGFCILSFFAGTLFPLLNLISASPALLCLLVALVLGIAGVLTSIISIIESIDRRYEQAMMLPQMKEQRYANRN